MEGQIVCTIFAEETAKSVNKATREVLKTKCTMFKEGNLRQAKNIVTIYYMSLLHISITLK